MYWVHLATCNSGATPSVLYCVTRSVLPATGWSRSLMDYDPPLFEGTSSQVETRIQGGNRVSLTVNVKGTSFQQCHFVWRNELRSFHAIQLDSARRRSLASTLFIRWVQAWYAQIPDRVLLTTNNSSRSQRACLCIILAKAGKWMKQTFDTVTCVN